MDDQKQIEPGLTRDKFDASLNKVLDISKESAPIQAFHNAALEVIFQDGIATEEECAAYWAELKALLPNLRNESPFA